VAVTLLLLWLGCGGGAPSPKAGGDGSVPTDSGTASVDGGAAGDGGTTGGGGSGGDGGGDDTGTVDVLGQPDGPASLCDELGADLQRLEFTSIHGREYFWRDQPATAPRFRQITSPSYLLEIQGATGDASVCDDPFSWSWNWNPVGEDPALTDGSCISDGVDGRICANRARG